MILYVQCLVNDFLSPFVSLFFFQIFLCYTFYILTISLTCIQNTIIIITFNFSRFLFNNCILCVTSCRGTSVVFKAMWCTHTTQVQAFLHASKVTHRK